LFSGVEEFCDLHRLSSVALAEGSGGESPPSANPKNLAYHGDGRKLRRPPTFHGGSECLGKQSIPSKESIGPSSWFESASLSTEIMLGRNAS
jgi:hypothetical protein